MPLPILTALLLAGQAASPPPIVSVSPVLRIASYESGSARCGPGEERPLHSEAPLPTAVVYTARDFAPAPVMLQFRIAEDGRPLGIRRTGAAPAGPQPDSGDVIPAFATWRFAPGPVRTGCTIGFTPRISSLEEADPALLQRYAATSRPRMPGYNSRVAAAAFRALRPQGSTCFDPRPPLRVQVNPPFERIPVAPGAIDHNVFTFDVDASGRPVNLRMAGSDGNAALDREGAEALRQWRFAPGERSGCLWSWYRRATAPLEAPMLPPASAYRPDGATCPGRHGGVPFAHMPPSTFPPNFEHRAIEGVAIVRFDVAPWGAVGNVSALAAEPAADFGEHAVRLVSGGRVAESQAGYRGCVTRVLFRMPGRSGEFEPAEDLEG